MEHGPNAHPRFIPREDLSGFTSWRPAALGGSDGASARAASPTEERATQQAAVQAARRAGYQDGYRDGLAALEGFKQSFAMQTTAQIGQLVAAFDAGFAELEAQIAQAVAASATALARQVVLAELKTQPELVNAVAAQALDAVLLSARHIRVHVSPEDLALVQQGTADALAARHARLVADAAIARGGCRIESDLGRVDATIETRWTQAAAVLGQPLPLAAAAPQEATSASGILITRDVAGGGNGA
jgi:flagellar assembly protein FliH